VHRLAESFPDANQSDLLRGVIIAAKEDVLDGRASRRAEKLEAVAVAV